MSSESGPLDSHIPESYWLCLELDLDLLQNNDLVIFCSGLKPLALPSMYILTVVFN